MEAQFKLIDSPELPPNLARCWDDLLSTSSNLYKMYQSLPWWLHLISRGDQSNYDLVSVEDTTGKVIGIIPLKKSLVSTNVTFKRREMKISSFNCLEVLGSQLILPASSDLYSKFLEWVWKNYQSIDAVYFKSIPQNSYDWQFMSENQWNIDGSLVYKLSNERDFFALKTAETFEAYLEKQFKKKKRYNLKRQVRLLQEVADNKLEIACITEVDKVPDFNRHVRAITSKSWKAKKLSNYIPDYVQDDEYLKDVASRQLLRAYLLYLDGKPITYVLGYQFQDVYHYSDIGFDEDYARYSPGSVLLFLLIEDLIKHTGLRLVNFGIGDSEYKRQFANESIPDNSLILLRNSFRNRFHYRLNEFIKQAKEKVRSYLK